jgi:CubicO group peptidase (beta-lactamase class C family)
MMTASAFQPLHDAMAAQVRLQFLPGVSHVLLSGQRVVDRFVHGHADRENSQALRDDHIFRIFSNTKLVTSCAILLLVEDGKLRLDDPVERYLPALGQRQVLRPGATRIDDVEPAQRPITVQHLMTHTAGLSYGLFDPGTLIFGAYQRAGLRDPKLSGAQFIERLGTLPLTYHPGEQWEYSLATDVLGHLIEVVAGQSLGDFFAQRIFQPLGMVDTCFALHPDQYAHMAALYVGMDVADPTRPGLQRMDNVPYPGAYQASGMRQSGGGGLVSTLDDMVRLLQALLPGASRPLLQADSVALMFRNQLAAGQHVQFPNMPSNPGRVFGLGSAVLAMPGPLDPPGATGEVSWGGVAGTVWFINPRLNIGGVLMTQRYMGFGNPYTFEFARLAYQGLGH